MPKELSLIHPCGLHIGKDLPELEVQAIDGVQVRDMRTGFVWYRLPEAQIAGQRITMSLCFFERRLDRISLAVLDDKLFGSSWDDWSASKEHARASATMRWLADVGYAVGTYSWGAVYAGTDPKTGDGSGGITLTSSR
ncbi:MAG: hypothetical protein ABJC26_08750 [Gemmatimonadaceae bacterium]